MTDWRERPHRRYNPLRDEWVLVSPERLQRPWQGEDAPFTLERRPAYDAACYLCPGNHRAGGEQNPQYESTYAFDNDYAALTSGIPHAAVNDGLLTARSERGRCRVLCFSPRHDLDVAQMSTPQVRGVIDAWASEYANLGAAGDVRAVTIFENRGAMMGASNPHPHGQIWAEESIPDEVVSEQRAQAAYRQSSGTCLLCAYADQELRAGERVIYANEHCAVVVPFWAVWPFEAMLVPRRHVPSLDFLSGEERDALAQAMVALTSRYDRLFAAPFPYSMGFHQQPTDGDPHEEWHLHAHYFPPLLRSATVRKYMVGYELLAQPQRDITPEQAAERIRNA